MKWQNRRRAALCVAPLSKAARVACAVAALALFAILPACVGASGQPGESPAPVVQERFDGQWLVEYRTETGKTSLTLRYSESKRGKDGQSHIGQWNTTNNI